MAKKYLTDIASVHTAIEIARQNISEIEDALEDARQTERDLRESFYLPGLEQVYLPSKDSVEVLTAACSIFAAAGVKLGLPDIGQHGFCSYIVSNDEDGAPLLVLLNNGRYDLAVFVRSKFAEALMYAKLGREKL